MKCRPTDTVPPEDVRRWSIPMSLPSSVGGSRCISSLDGCGNPQAGRGALRSHPSSPAPKLPFGSKELRLPSRGHVSATVRGVEHTGFSGRIEQKGCGRSRGCRKRVDLERATLTRVVMERTVGPEPSSASYP